MTNNSRVPPTPGGRTMASDQTHADHDHAHGPGCGHTGVKHDGHTDYLHDGHLHHTEADGTVTEHAVAVGAANPDACTPAHNCGGHTKGHVHGPGRGHEPIPHGQHTDP